MTKELIRKKVEKLLKNGNAYVAGDNIYFAVGGFNDYGKLSRNQTIAMSELACIIIKSDVQTPTATL